MLLSGVLIGPTRFWVNEHWVFVGSTVSKLYKRDSETIRILTAGKSQITAFQRLNPTV
jgi:hypothetical protein